MVDYKQKYLQMKLKYISAKQKAGMILEQNLDRIENEAYIEMEFNKLVQQGYIDNSMLDFIDDKKQIIQIKKELVEFFNSSLEKSYYHMSGISIPIQFIEKKFQFMLNKSNLPPFLEENFDQTDVMQGLYDEYLKLKSNPQDPNNY